MEVQGSNSSWSKRCRPEEKEIPKTATNPDGVSKILPNATGAISLADNFIYEFRCASHSAGNSRQAFEVPGMLAGIGAATALALGAGSNVAIGGAAATSLADGSKDYYAPITKAEIYGSALDAFLCIKSTAVGVSPFMISGEKAIGAKATTLKGAAAKPAGASYFSPERRYFELVSTALFTTERIAASRLRNSARYDAAGVVSQLKDKLNEIEEAESDDNTEENERTAAELTSGSIVVETEGVDPDTGSQNTTTKVRTDPAGDAAVVADSLNQLDVLKPQLDICILRAKL